MLKRFEVKNYKGFKDNIVWDLRATRDYSFQTNLVRNKIVTAATVFGKNGAGKSSLCTALVDITTHLLDVEKDHTPPHLYSHIGNNTSLSEFKYVFQFDMDEVEYYYAKTNNREMASEILLINGKPVVLHNFIDERENFISIPGAENLRTKGLQKQLSVIKYIYNNTIQDESSVISKIIRFVSGMLYFRSLKDANQYIGIFGKHGAKTSAKGCLFGRKLRHVFFRAFFYLALDRKRTSEAGVFGGGGCHSDDKASPSDCRVLRKRLCGMLLCPAGSRHARTSHGNDFAKRWRACFDR
jgi:hypothetical protein